MMTVRCCGSIDCRVKTVVGSAADIAPPAAGERNAVLLNGNLNYDLDIEATLTTIKSRLTRLSRVVVVLYNPYFRGLFWLATRLGLRTGAVPSTFVTRESMAALAKLSGYEVVQVKPAGYSPVRLLGIGDAINWAMPMVPLAALAGRLPRWWYCARSRRSPRRRA